jgi:sec-independent protein translocase protein TatB
MNILGMGPMEILLIVVLALIVFGPAKLPEIMGQVGKAIADFRRATSELSDEFNRTIQAELQETRALVDDTKSTVTGVHTSINSAITGTPAPVLTAVPGESAPNGTSPQATTNGTHGTAPAQVTPPRADTSQWSWETATPAPAKPPVEFGSIDPVVGLAETTPPVVEAPVAPLTPPAKVRKPVRDELLPPY